MRLKQTTRHYQLTGTASIMKRKNRPTRDAGRSVEPRGSRVESGGECHRIQGEDLVLHEGPGVREGALGASAQPVRHGQLRCLGPQPVGANFEEAGHQLPADRCLHVEAIVGHPVLEGHHIVVLGVGAEAHGCERPLHGVEEDDANSLKISLDEEAESGLGALGSGKVGNADHG